MDSNKFEKTISYQFIPEQRTQFVIFFVCFLNTHACFWILNCERWNSRRTNTTVRTITNERAQTLHSNCCNRRLIHRKVTVHLATNISISTTNNDKTISHLCMLKIYQLLLLIITFSVSITNNQISHKNKLKTKKWIFDSFWQTAPVCECCLRACAPDTKNQNM